MVRKSARKEPLPRIAKLSAREQSKPKTRTYGRRSPFAAKSGLLPRVREEQETEED